MGAARLFSASFLGQRDLQQCAVIRQMVRDLNLPIEVVTVPTVRESDCLALIRCNSNLGPTDRTRALCLDRSLLAAETAYGEGECVSDRLIAVARSQMTEVDQLQYLELQDARTVCAIQGLAEKPTALCVAAYGGPTRLINNVLLIPPPKALDDRELELDPHVIGHQARMSAEAPQPS
ncbi:MULTISPECIES: pantoate--beta-alanine ligase [Microvirga]|uniref:pantoate--beta-alanine ligase n=1 Tax=Microvirga TaxID=186650 RepID=UPI000E0D3F03|nr:MULTISPECIES: pantoate--beta-alanine ligase [Microvirga]MBQ0818998.1 pantoate--beta-alanine ligase [Microvirga sp. HBU67558]